MNFKLATKLRICIVQQIQKYLIFRVGKKIIIQFINMKKLLFFLLYAPLVLFGQAEQAKLLYHWEDSNMVGSFAYNNAYNEIWGVVANDREFAVIGSTAGTHFFDVTDPANAKEVAFVAGAVQGDAIIHRDYHDYQCYLYVVADEGPSTMQIIDYSNLPNSVEVVYDSNEFLQQSHNIFIDTSAALLYSASTKTTNNYIRLRVLSLENPEVPTLVNDYSNIAGSSISGIHDIYVREGIAYLNLGGNNGLMIADFTDTSNPQYLGSITDYPQKGYNHSGWLSEDGNTYYLADETHDTDIKAIDVSDVTDIEVLTTFDAESSQTFSIPHNLIVRGNYLYVSYYYDGLQVYDISDPNNPQRVAYYDTYPDENRESYEGAWGVFPYLPSGNILISDMQTGLYVFEKIDETITGEMSASGTSTNCAGFVSVSHPDEVIANVKISPQPIDNQINLSFSLSKAQTIEFSLINQNGQVVRQLESTSFPAGQHQNSYLLRSDLPKGIYFLHLKGTDYSGMYKVVKI